MVYNCLRVFHVRVVLWMTNSVIFIKWPLPEGSNRATQSLLIIGSTHVCAQMKSEWLSHPLFPITDYLFVIAASYFKSVLNVFFNGPCNPNWWSWGKCPTGIFHPSPPSYYDSNQNIARYLVTFICHKPLCIRNTLMMALVYIVFLWPWHLYLINCRVFTKLQMLMLVYKY